MTPRGEEREGSAGVHRRCGRCGAKYTLAAFADLAPVQTLAEADLVEHVVRWPDGAVIDVRTCARCRAPMARLARRAS